MSIVETIRQQGGVIHRSVRDSNYDYAGGDPFDVQFETVAMLTENPRAYVLSSMGTGKTKCVLWAFDYLRRVSAAQRMLVVAPLSTLKFTWGREIFATTPHYKYQVLHSPNAAKRLERLGEPADIYIVNHDGLGLIAQEVIARHDIDVLVIDELGVYRNRTKRSRIAEHVSRAKPVVWGMTGAPTPNAPTDAWQEGKIITPHTVPKYFSGFRDLTMYRVNQFKWLPKNDANDHVLRALSPNVRYTLDDVVELPPFVTRMVDVDIGPKQKKIYDEVRKAAYAMVQNGEIRAPNAGAVMSKLLQISLGWVYLNDGSAHELDPDARIKALIDTVDSAEGKTIVFVPFKHALQAVQQALINAGYKGTMLVDGDTPPTQRDKIFRRFQEDAERDPLVAHPQCVAHGITLTAANVVCWFGPITSTEIYEQANARIRRVGQKLKQLFLHFVGTPAERHIYGLLKNKVNVQDKLLEMLEQETWNER